MPRCGSQIILCDIPVRLDTYKGCSHKCKYCFASKKYNLDDIKPDETPKALASFIGGARNRETNWCDWDIPLHWGGLSDPFQPIEGRLHNSLECLKVFAETQYPFVFSTKGAIVAEKQYLKLIAQCNCVGQISLLTKRAAEYFEPGAPSFDQRLLIADKLAPHVKRLIIRIQPYMPEFKAEILSLLSIYKKIGVYGVILEGLKLSKIKPPCTEKAAGDFCIPTDILQKHFREIKAECHRVGLKFFAGENRLRSMGDSLCCCGAEGIDGWKLNTANLNHIYFGNDAEFTKHMKKENTAWVFTSLRQTTICSRVYGQSKFADIMQAYAKDKKGRAVYGIK